MPSRLIRWRPCGRGPRPPGSSARCVFPAGSCSVNRLTAPSEITRPRFRRPRPSHLRQHSQRHRRRWPITADLGMFTQNLCNKGRLIRDCLRALRITKNDGFVRVERARRRLCWWSKHCPLLPSQLPSWRFACQATSSAAIKDPMSGTVLIAGARSRSERSAPNPATCGASSSAGDRPKPWS